MPKVMQLSSDRKLYINHQGSSVPIFLVFGKTLQVYLFLSPGWPWQNNHVYPYNS